MSSIPGTTSHLPPRQHTGWRQPRVLIHRNVRAATREPRVPLSWVGIFFVALLLPPAMITPWGTMGTPVAALLAVVATVSAAMMGRGRRKWLGLAPLGIVLVAVVSTGLAAVRADFDWQYVRGTPAHWLAFAALLMMVRAWVRQGGSGEKLIHLILIASVPISLMAIIEYATKSYIRIDLILAQLSGLELRDSIYRTGVSDFRSLATAGNPLALSALTGFAAMAGLGIYVKTGKAWYPALIAVHLAATLTTMSRSAWLAVLIGFAVVAARGGAQSLPVNVWRSLGLTFLAFVVGSIVFLSLEGSGDTLQTFADTLRERLGSIAGSSSYTHRTTIVGRVIGDFEDTPEDLLLGKGVSGENAFFLARSPMVMSGHAERDVFQLRTFDNTYLTAFYCFGAVGLFLFARLFVAAIRNAWRLKTAGLWLFLPLITVAICSYFYNVICTPLVNLLLATGLGIALETGNAIKANPVAPVGREGGVVLQ